MYSLVSSLPHFFFFHSCILPLFPSLFHSFIHSFIHSLTHSFIHSFMHACMHSFMYACIHPFIHWLSIHACMHAFIHSFNQHQSASKSQSVSDWFIRSFLRSFIQSFVQDFFGWAPHFKILPTHQNFQQFRVKKCSFLWLCPIFEISAPARAGHDLAVYVIDVIVYDILNMSQFQYDNSINDAEWMKLFRIVRVTERVETSQRMVSLSAKSFQTSSALSCKVRQLQAQLTMTQFLQQGARKNVCLQEPQDSWIFHMGAALGETSFLQKN
jgi:hypothetical protein